MLIKNPENNRHAFIEQEDSMLIVTCYEGAVFKKKYMEADPYNAKAKAESWCNPVEPEEDLTTRKSLTGIPELDKSNEPAVIQSLILIREPNQSISIGTPIWWLEGQTRVTEIVQLDEPNPTFNIYTGDTLATTIISNDIIVRYGKELDND